MTVKVRPYRRGGWEVDIVLKLADSKTHRERRKAPVSSKSGAKKWGEDCEWFLLLNPPDSGRALSSTSNSNNQVEETKQKEVPTFA